MAVKTSSKKKNKKGIVIDNTFKFDEIITQEERAIMYGVANGQVFDVKDINEQLRIARYFK